MAAAPLASIGDLEKLLGGPLAGADAERAEQVLVRVSSLVRSDAGATWAETPVPDEVVTIVLDVAYRVFTNPQNLRQTQAGPFSGSYAFVGLQLTAAELRIVKRAAGRRKGLKIISTGRGDHHAPAVHVPTGPPPAGPDFPWYATDDPIAGT